MAVNALPVAAWPRLTRSKIFQPLMPFKGFIDQGFLSSHADNKRISLRAFGPDGERGKRGRSLRQISARRKGVMRRKEL
jgi:hypothetical protein